MTAPSRTQKFLTGGDGAAIFRMLGTQPPTSSAASTGRSCGDSEVPASVIEAQKFFGITNTRSNQLNLQQQPVPDGSLASVLQQQAEGYPTQPALAQAASAAQFCLRLVWHKVWMTSNIVMKTAAIYGVHADGSQRSALRPQGIPKPLGIGVTARAPSHRRCSAISTRQCGVSRVSRP